MLNLDSVYGCMMLGPGSEFDMVDFEVPEINILPWPPDLSAIEHVWEIMGIRIQNLQQPLQTLAAKMSLWWSEM